MKSCGGSCGQMKTGCIENSSGSETRSLTRSGTMDHRIGIPQFPLGINAKIMVAVIEVKGNHSMIEQ